MTERTEVSLREAARQNWKLLTGMGAAIVAAALFAVSTKKPPAPPQAIVAPVATGPTPMDIAVDAANAIRGHYELAGRANSADWKAATCNDTLKSYKALIDCYRASLAEIQHAQGLMRQAHPAKYPCGQEIQRVSEAYVGDLLKHHSAYVDWLNQAPPAGRAAIQGRTIRDVCRSNKKMCEGEPLLEASFSTVNDVQCTKEMFLCTPPYDNVCWINKVADRLARNDGTLFVRATGQRLPLP
jgi:hypothetical protein